MMKPTEIIKEIEEKIKFEEKPEYSNCNHIRCKLEAQLETAKQMQESFIEMINRFEKNILTPNCNSKNFIEISDFNFRLKKLKQEVEDGE